MALLPRVAEALPPPPVLKHQALPANMLKANHPPAPDLLLVPLVAFPPTSVCLPACPAVLVLTTLPPPLTLEVAEALRLLRNEA